MPRRFYPAYKACDEIGCEHGRIERRTVEVMSAGIDENTALNLSWMRKMALPLLKAETSFKASIHRKQLRLLSSPDYLLKVISQL